MKGEDLGKILKSHTDRQADLVTDVDKLQLTTQLKDATGNPLEIKMDTPIMKAAAAMAKERGWTKSDLTAMAEIVGQQQLATMEADHKEFLSLGAGDEAKANARYNALQAKGAARLGADEQGKATPEAVKDMTRLIASIHSKADFEVLERLIGVEAPGAAEAGGGNTVTRIADHLYPNENKKKAS